MSSASVVFTDNNTRNWRMGEDDEKQEIVSSKPTTDIEASYHSPGDNENFPVAAEYLLYQQKPLCNMK